MKPSSIPDISSLPELFREWLWFFESFSVSDCSSVVTGHGVIPGKPNLSSSCIRFWSWFIISSRLRTSFSNVSNLKK